MQIISHFYRVYRTRRHNCISQFSSKLTLLVLTYKLHQSAIIMALFETQRSTKTLVILTKLEEWRLWLFQHKEKAALHGLWKYCDLLVSTLSALSLNLERPMLPDGNLTTEIL
jgi:hypothetical protein